MIAIEARKRYGDVVGLEGIFEFKHPHGCSQIGEDHLITQKILADLVMHPNAGSVLVLGLGCENNHVEDLKKVIGSWDKSRVKFLIAQDVEDEIESGLQLIEALVENVRTDERVECSLSDLRVGLECGGSDAFSGITANPIVGALSDLIIAGGGTTVLTEVPEMFGAETILMDRACNKVVFQKTVDLINDYKSYFIRYDQPIYENPSYGNKEGGLTTLEEKSLGCIQKGGRAPVSGVLKYGETLYEKGLNLLSGPGNDVVSCTGLAAAGCQLVVFTTGRGTPLGTCVPTIKVATNRSLYDKKNKWFDFNGGRLLEGNSISGCAEELLDIVVAVCGGQRTRTEEMGCREIAILKDGVTC
jgi:altronate hydrolase